MYTCLGCQKKRKMTAITMSSTKKDHLVSDLITATKYIDSAPTGAAVPASPRRHRVGRLSRKMYNHRHFSSFGNIITSNRF